jgi:predicted short-subunit dehydrogenase-like oxidoreductase (DUF2520 family)
MSDNVSRPVVVVGAGGVGLSLARALTGVRPVAGVVVRSPASHQRAVAAGFEVLALEDARVAEAGTVLLCVPDDELPALVRALAGTTGDGQLVVHTSGRHGLDVLSGLSGPVAAIHPAMTFTGTSADAAIPRDITYGVTATGQGLTEAVALVGDLGGRVELVPDERRPLYHAAISHAANHLNTLIADAADLLRASGIGDTEALLGPITRTALANALASGTGALTGPVVRGDVGTVAAHLEALAGKPAGPPYRALARRTADRAEAAGRLPAGQAEAIRAVLASSG